MFKSPLRYPGGKQKAIPQIASYIPSTFKEFREPFVGGGSVFFYVLQKYPSVSYWVNDLNQELYYFWHQVKVNLPKLVAEVWKVKHETEEVDGFCLNISKR